MDTEPKEAVGPLDGNSGASPGGLLQTTLTEGRALRRDLAVADYVALTGDHWTSFEMPPRISPLTDACHHVGLKTDKTWKMEVKYINAVKGSGVFAIGSFSKGDFIVEYRGDLISDDGEAQKRRRIYNPACSGFLFCVQVGRQNMVSIDASREDGSFGRLVNDDHRHPN
ncbi:unnamed protein product [Arctogadus glacialis]